MEAESRPDQEPERPLVGSCSRSQDEKSSQKKKSPNDVVVENTKEGFSVPHCLLTRLRSRGQDEISPLKNNSSDDELVDNIDEESLVPHRPLKRLRHQNHKLQVSPFSNTCNPMPGSISLIKPKVEVDETLDTRSPQQP